jgi:hypothetical protein
MKQPHQVKWISSSIPKFPNSLHPAILHSKNSYCSSPNHLPIQPNQADKLAKEDGGKTREAGQWEDQAGRSRKEE